MYRVIVLYDEEPDAAAYAEHAELCRQVPNGDIVAGNRGRAMGLNDGDD